MSVSLTTVPGMPPAPRPLVDPAAVARFWAAVAEAPDTLGSDMIEAARAGRQTPEFARLSELLESLHPNVLLTIGSNPNPDGRDEIVISAGGIKSAFPAAFAIVDAAPPEVTARFAPRALRPRVGDPQSLTMRLFGRTLGPADIRWSATPQRRNKGVVDVTFHIPGWIDALPPESQANENLAGLVFVILDHLLGEYSVATQIGNIDWRSDKNAEGLPNLLAFADYLDRLAAQ